jgi:sterol desaturase/sphingolipid hydroxylase (fatty acid hydroxylase superfamily)
VIRFAFTTLAVVVAGAPIWMVMLYQSLSVLLSQFNHSNIGLPPSVDRWLSLVIVTPDMHHVHHHHEQPLTDRNFGNIFSIWDRLFGPYAAAPKESLVYGIDSHPDAAEASSVRSLFLMPFRAGKTNR